MVADSPTRASPAGPVRARRGDPTALAGLRRATHAAHEALERASPLLARDVCRADVCAYLGAIAPLVACAEAFAVACAPRLRRFAYDFTPVRRHHRLLADLDHLRPRGEGAGGASPAAYARALAPHASVGGRLGVLYVLEGSTLGGQLLCRRLGQTLGLGPEQLGYLAGHGRATGARWRQTCALLEAVLTTPRRQAEANAAATTTFALFARAVAASGGGHAPS